MSNRGTSNASIVLALCVALTACGIHWPWRHREPSPPPPAQELIIAAADGAVPAPIPQFWDRNTLLLDLTAVSGEGGVVLRPLPGHVWPIRLEFRVQPGRFVHLDVTALERVVFQVPAEGAPVVFRLAPGAYLRDTAQITLRWSVADDSAR
jgi:hypothetical protein